MGIARVDPEELKARARRAAERQWSQLGDVRELVSGLEVRFLKREDHPVARTVGSVAADAGLVSVELRPFSLEFLLVADSEGRTHVAELFPLTGLAEDMTRILIETPVIARMAERVGLEWPLLQSLWGGSGSSRPSFAEDTRLAADTLREIAEWSVAAELAVTERKAIDTPSRPSLVVLRDGFLRSFLLRNRVVSERLPVFWRDQWTQHSVALAGVGKTSILWQRLALSLDLDGRLSGEREGYVIVPEQLEQRLAGGNPGDRLGFGRVVLLKCREHGEGDYLPIDVPPWIVEERAALETTLASIATHSETAFPRPGYPGPLGAAHEAARLGKFDAAVIRDRVVEALSEALPAGEFEILRRSWAFQSAVWPKLGRGKESDT